MDKNEYQHLPQSVKELFKDYDVKYNEINIYLNPPGFELKTFRKSEEEFDEFINILSNLIFPQFVKEQEDKIKNYTFDKEDVDHIQTMVDIYKKQVIEYEEITKLLKENKYKYTPEQIKRRYFMEERDIEDFDYVNHKNTFILPIEMHLKTNLIINLEDTDQIKTFIDNMTNDINTNENIKIKTNKDKLYRLDPYEKVSDFSDNNLFLDELVGILTDYED